MKPKVCKIFCYPAHCDGKHVPGVDYARIILPMQELTKQPGFKVTIFDGKTPYIWKQVAEEYDILYTNYTTNPDAFVEIAFWFMKLGKKVVMDIDDLIWEIQDDNAAYSTYQPGSLGRATITDIVSRGVDFVTVTNQFLKYALAHHTDKELSKIGVLPNYIDLDLYKWTKKPQDGYEITIGYFGSSSHFNDLVNPGFIKGLSKAMKENPRIKFLTVGAMIPEMKKKFGSRYNTTFGDHDIYKWVKMIPELLNEVDLFVVPLLDCTYARAKSGIKFLEMSSMKIPGIYQDIRQYKELVENGVNGYLASTESDWYNSIKDLVESVELRKQIGESAYKTVKDNHTIQGNVQKYVDFFTKVI